MVARRLVLSFDRGTLVLRTAEREAGSGVVGPPETKAGIVKTVPSALFDPRVGAYRIPAFLYHEVREALSARGIAVCVRIRAKDLLRVGRWVEAKAFGLRPYQEAALVAWTARGRRGTVVLPTGSGKTRLALAIMAMSGLPALCLVPTRVLMHQWAEAIAAFYDGPVGRLGDGRRELRAVTVSTYASALRALPRVGARFGVLVVDEAHHFGVGVRDEALEMAIAPARLGLTATPPTDAAARERLETLLGPVVFQASVDDLAGRWLAQYDLVPVSISLSMRERLDYERELSVFRPVYRAFARTFPDGTWADFMRASARSEAGQAAVAAWRRARRILAYPEGKATALRGLLRRHRDVRVLVFTPDNAAAYRVAREHLVMPITCHIGREERARALSLFREGQLRVLVSARVLNEGLDVPDAEVAIIVGGTLGAREHVQRVGRLLRPVPGKRATVYELVVRESSEVDQAARRRVGLAS